MQVLTTARSALEEQARQGIGVIRRYFGWSKKDMVESTEASYVLG
jgi:hypothetical protein